MKTKKRMEILIQGQLKEIIERRMMLSDTYLFLNKQGRKLTAGTLWRWFDNLRKAAVSHFPELAEELKNFQFRDLRAKAATDKFLKSNIEAAQNQLGHKSPVMTARYIRKSKAVEPTR
ncbi:hypothetical protein A1D23_04620 [Chelonobacter oris]|nr:hypothetical protein [Chelonobacter oris]